MGNVRHLEGFCAPFGRRVEECTSGGNLSRGKLSDLELVRGEVVPVELVLFRCLPSRELVRGEVVRSGTCPGGSCLPGNLSIGALVRGEVVKGEVVCQPLGPCLECEREPLLHPSSREISPLLLRREKREFRYQFEVDHYGEPLLLPGELREDRQ